MANKPVNLKKFYLVTKPKLIGVFLSSVWVAYQLSDFKILSSLISALRFATI